MDLSQTENNGVFVGQEWQSLPQAYLAAVRHWFVESGGSYAGPVEVGDVERLWRLGEINEQTRVWTEGMDEWRTLGDVPDLMYLVLEPAAAVAPTTWQATDASTLASLVDSELDAITVAEVRPVRAGAETRSPDLPTIETFGAGDPFGRWWTESRVAIDTSHLHTDPWRKRLSAEYQTRRLQRALYAAATVAVASLTALALDISGVVDLSHRSRDPEHALRSVQTAALVPVIAAGAANETRPLDAGAQTAPAAAMLGSDSTPLAAVAPAASLATPAGQRQHVDETSSGASPAKDAAEVSEAAATTRLTPTHHEAPIAKTTTGEDSATRTEPAAGRPALTAKPNGGGKLSPQEIVEATRGQIKSLAPCLQRARTNGEIEAKQYAFVLDWHIRADGAVNAAKLKGPADVVATTVGSCFASAMQKWRYRASAEDFTVLNFPLPVNIH